jgi:hypothetical protein
MMKKIRLTLSTAVLILLCFSAAAALADDLVVGGPITGVQNYDSAEGIIFDAADVQSGADVTALSTFEVHINPGTHIAEGAHFLGSKSRRRCG